MGCLTGHNLEKLGGAHFAPIFCGPVRRLVLKDTPEYRCGFGEGGLAGLVEAVGQRQCYRPRLTA